MTVAIETKTDMGSEIGGAVKEKRMFVYGEHRLPDPGAQYTNEDVRLYLAGGTFPELANCRIDIKPMKGGIQEVHFVKQATSKG